jgi:hypothetical protein
LFSFIEIKKFLNDIRDRAWAEMNDKFDKEYFENLKNNLSKNFSRKNIQNIVEEAI